MQSVAIHLSYHIHHLIIDHLYVLMLMPCSALDCSISQCLDTLSLMHIKPGLHINDICAVVDRGRR